MPIPTLGILDIKIAINFYHKILINAKGQIIGLYTVSAKANKSNVGTRVRLPTLRHTELYKFFTSGKACIFQSFSIPLDFKGKYLGLLISIRCTTY